MQPIISESNYKKLQILINQLKTPEARLLGEEISKASIVSDNKIEKEIVCLNSEVEFIDKSLNKIIKLKIVLPENVDLKKNFVSVFSPISIALFGFKQSYTFEWKLPSGIKNIEIIKVSNN